MSNRTLEHPRPPDIITMKENLKKSVSCSSLPTLITLNQQSSGLKLSRLPRRVPVTATGARIVAAVPRQPVVQFQNGNPTIMTSANSVTNLSPASNIFGHGPSNLSSFHISSKVTSSSIPQPSLGKTSSLLSGNKSEREEAGGSVVNNSINGSLKSCARKRTNSRFMEDQGAMILSSNLLQCPSSNSFSSSTLSCQSLSPPLLLPLDSSSSLQSNFLPLKPEKDTKTIQQQKVRRVNGLYERFFFLDCIV